MGIGSLLLALALAQGGEDYKDSRGRAVHFPLGDKSFADEVVSYETGRPEPKAANARDPEEALGAPDYSAKYRTHSVTLGCGGALTLRFTDNALVDVDGPDLYVFEVGPAIEPTKLEISRDGKTWIDVGKISGGTADVDIAKHVKAGESFTYVRLTDLKEDCGGEWPGADIDAVGAFGK